jgi:hypothetical protein
LGLLDGVPASPSAIERAIGRQGFIRMGRGRPEPSPCRRRWRRRRSWRRRRQRGRFRRHDWSNFPSDRGRWRRHELAGSVESGREYPARIPVKRHERPLASPNAAEVHVPAGAPVELGAVCGVDDKSARPCVLRGDGDRFGLRKNPGWRPWVTFHNTRAGKQQYNDKAERHGPAEHLPWFESFRTVGRERAGVGPGLQVQQGLGAHRVSCGSS